MIVFELEQLEAARQGNRAALDAVVRTAERPIYNLAIRMLACPADAEDATQEILIKFITHLGELRDNGAAGGWVMRIATHHLLKSRKPSRIEAMSLSFESFATDLREGLSETDRDNPSPEENLAIEEIKVGCTLAMLTCLSRPLRIAYLLGDVFELTDTEAATVLEITPATYRQRLKRGRQSIQAFLLTHCGNASTSAACRCEKRIPKAKASGRLIWGHSMFGLETERRQTVRALRTTVTQLDKGRRAAALLRSNPDFTSNITSLVTTTMDISLDLGSGG